MSSIWDRFDGIATPTEVEESKAKFAPIESGTYKMVLEEIAPAESKDGLPMLKGKFRIVENNRVMFYNQMLQNINMPHMTAVNIAEAVNFVGDLLGKNVEFEGLIKFAGTVESIPLGTEYDIQISYGTKDVEMKFPKFKIVKQAIKATGTEDFMNPIGDEFDETPFN